MGNEIHVPKKILVVEDEEVIRRLLARVLIQPDYDLVLVGTIREGLERIDQTNWDMLITDLRLPDGDGADVIQRFKNKSRELPIIVITGSPTPGSRMPRALDLDVQECIYKPFELDVIQTAVRAALE